MTALTMDYDTDIEYSAQNSTEVFVTQTTTRNVYRYDKQNLLISYAAATSLTLLAVAVGIYSLLSNGVAHSMAFSAIMATTRNAGLDSLSEGQSLGALPLDDQVKDVKLRFGGMSDEHSSRDGRRLGFGFEHGVQPIEKFDRYI